MRSYRGRPRARLIHLALVWIGPALLGWVATGSHRGALTGGTLAWVIYAWALVGANGMALARLLETDLIMGPPTAYLRAIFVPLAPIVNAVLLTLSTDPPDGTLARAKPGKAPPPA